MFSELTATASLSAAPLLGAVSMKALSVFGPVTNSIIVASIVTVLILWFVRRAMESWAYYVKAFASIKEGDGTLLDHSLILYGSNMGNSNQHLHYDVPHVLLGGASGQIMGNRHLAFPSKTVPTGNLLLSILDLYGIHQDSFGDSTGRIESI